MKDLMNAAIKYLNSAKGQKMVKPIFEAARAKGVPDNVTREKILEGLYFKMLHDNKDLMKKEAERIGSEVYNKLKK